MTTYTEPFVVSTNGINTVFFYSLISMANTETEKKLLLYYSEGSTICVHNDKRRVWDLCDHREHRDNEFNEPELDDKPQTVR